jgi:tRNA-dihydrouridine synthase B
MTGAERSGLRRDHADEGRRARSEAVSGQRRTAGPAGRVGQGAGRAGAGLGQRPGRGTLDPVIRSLTDSWDLGPVRIPNRVVLAPLAGIGNWFVRLQAKRYGAGLAVSEMVSSHAIHYGNRRTLEELLLVHPDERTGGPVALQLFGADPEIMRSAAAVAAERGADLIDLNMGCPVPKVMKTGAGAALIREPGVAVAVARAAREGSGLPVTVKLRAGVKPGGMEGGEVARRLVEDAGVAGLTFHPRSAAVRHKGTPDYELAARLVAELPVPVIVSGGMEGADHVRWVFEHTGCAAVMLARGSLGNPWLFSQVLDAGVPEPSPEEVLAEWAWVLDRCVEHLGEDRAARYLRKFHPWYLARLGLEPAARARDCQDTLQRAETIAEQRAVLDGLGVPVAA